jgi:pimeloyl-ACP methyl ester carboxylesterase
VEFEEEMTSRRGDPIRALVSGASRSTDCTGRESDGRVGNPFGTLQEFRREPSGQEGGDMGENVSGRLVVSDGESVQSMLPADRRAEADRRLRTGPGERTVLTDEHHRDVLGNDMSEEQLADTLARVGSDSMRFFTDVVSWGAGPRPPITYVRLRDDRAVPWEDQEEMIRRLGPEVSVEEIAAGHEVMITQPAALADLLNPLLSASADGVR